METDGIVIHKLLTLTRPLICLDAETTGVDTQSDRIVELAFEVWKAEGLESDWRSLINPSMMIPAEVTAIHGIKDEDMVGCRVCAGKLQGSLGDKICTCDTFKPIPTFKQIAEKLARGFSDCDFMGKNVRFDLQILAAEFARAGIAWTIGDARILDADRLEAWLNKRSLSHLYRKYVRTKCDECDGLGAVSDRYELGNVNECEDCGGVGSFGRKLDGAHGALADVRASTTVIAAQMDAFTQNEDEAVQLPRDIGALHDLQFPGFIDLGNKFTFDKDGVPRFTRWGKYAGKPMCVADNGYWDFVLKSDFAADVKVLAGNAKLGKFPEKKV